MESRACTNGPCAGGEEVIKTKRGSGVAGQDSSVIKGEKIRIVGRSDRKSTVSRRGGELRIAASRADLSGESGVG